MNKEDIIKYVLSTPANTNPNILRGMLDALDTGSSSDFTTCELTYLNNDEDSHNLIVANIATNDPTQTYGSVDSGGFGSRQEVQVVLYKGMAWATFQEDQRPPDANISVTGAIEYDAVSDYFYITGDGTITVDE